MNTYYYWLHIEEYATGISLYCYCADKFRADCRVAVFPLTRYAVKPNGRPYSQIGHLSPDIFKSYINEMYDVDIDRICSRCNNLVITKEEIKELRGLYVLGGPEIVTSRMESGYPDRIFEKLRNFK